MKIKKYVNISLCLSLLISGKTLSFPDNLPSISPADQEIIKQKQKDILEEFQKQQDLGLDIKADKPKELSTLDDKLLCQVINNISIENAIHFPKSNQEKLIKKNISKCMTTTDIDSLINTISVYYMEKGYITSRAFLRQQDAPNIFKGNLIITVIEGKIDSLNIDGRDLLSLKMAFPNMKGKILNLRDIEQGLEQLNRLHSYQVKIDIQPSAKVGYSDVILKKIPLNYL